MNFSVFFISSSSETCHGRCGWRDTCGDHVCKGSTGWWQLHCPAGHSTQASWLESSPFFKLCLIDVSSDEVYILLIMDWVFRLCFPSAVLDSLPVSEGALQLHIQNLFDAWWKKGLEEKEKFGRTAFLFSLQKSFMLKKPVSDMTVEKINLAFKCRCLFKRFNSVVRVLRSKEFGVYMKCF